MDIDFYGYLIRITCKIELQDLISYINYFFTLVQRYSTTQKQNVFSRLGINK